MSLEMFTDERLPTDDNSSPTGVAISIRQPWAWMIVHAGKNIENRSWPTKFRGKVLVHASKGMTRDEYHEALHVMLAINKSVSLPAFEDLQRGGIIGEVEITDCVSKSPSPWFFGDYGFVLQNPRPLPFYAYKGQLGFFKI